jgi:hypothetical protein
MYAQFDGKQVSAYPMDHRGDHSYGMMGPGHYAACSIVSIQNDENGVPSWILSCYGNSRKWKSKLSSIKLNFKYGERYVQEWQICCII